MQWISAVALAIALSGCGAAPWMKNKSDATDTGRQQAAIDRETWSAEESRRLLALCLDIAKFEKQWANYSGWSFDPETGVCTVEYKKTGPEKKTEKECADLWLTGEGWRDGNAPSMKAPTRAQNVYYSCIAETFSRDWKVQQVAAASPSP